MYSKKESQKLKQEFWVAFATAYPRKWLLYDTSIKDLSLKFYVDNKKAEVMISLEMRDILKRHAYFDKLLSLKTILNDYCEDLLFGKDLHSDGGRHVSRVWKTLPGVNIYNPQDWPKIFKFLSSEMANLEVFFNDFDGFIKDI